jgi:plasmid maintenance system killer protein
MRVDAAAEMHQETRREIHTLTQQAIRRLDILSEANEDTCRQMRVLHEDLVGRLGLLHDALPKQRKGSSGPL